MRDLLPHENPDDIMKYGVEVVESGWRDHWEASYETLYEYAGEFYLHVYCYIIGCPEVNFMKHVELDFAVSWLDAVQKETLDHGKPTTPPSPH